MKINHCEWAWNAESFLLTYNKSQLTEKSNMRCCVDQEIQSKKQSLGFLIIAIKFHKALGLTIKSNICKGGGGGVVFVVSFLCVFCQQL